MDCRGEVHAADLTSAHVIPPSGPLEGARSWRYDVTGRIIVCCVLLVLLFLSTTYEGMLPAYNVSMRSHVSCMCHAQVRSRFASGSDEEGAPAGPEDFAPFLRCLARLGYTQVCGCGVLSGVCL